MISIKCLLIHSFFWIFFSLFYRNWLSFINEKLDLYYTRNKKKFQFFNNMKFEFLIGVLYIEWMIHFIDGKFLLIWWFSWWVLKVISRMFLIYWLFSVIFEIENLILIFLGVEICEILNYEALINLIECNFLKTGISEIQGHWTSQKIPG